MTRLLLACVVLASCSYVGSSDLATCTKADKAAKAVVCAMDHALVGMGDGWKNYTIWYEAMQAFWAKDFTYTPAYGINQTIGLHNWYYGENLIWFKAFPTGIFNQMLFLGDDANASSMTYSIGIWEDYLGPLAPTRKRTNIRIMDAYTVSEGRITHNWMMIDMLDLRRQTGDVPLPLSSLPQGRDFPPMAMEGIPAPISLYVNPQDTESSRRIVHAMFAADWTGDSEALTHWSEKMIWYGPVPFGMAQGKAEYRAHFIQPLHNAFADRGIVLDMITCEGKFCAAHGHFTGVHVGIWLGHEATNSRMRMDFGMHWHFEGGVIVESWAIFDLPKMFLQLGVDLLGGGKAAHTLALKRRLAAAELPDSLSDSRHRTVPLKASEESETNLRGKDAFSQQAIAGLIGSCTLAVSLMLMVRALQKKRLISQDGWPGSPFLSS